MSITLITGIPGAGKTLFAVSKLKQAIEENMALPAEEQRKIYCDITGLNIEGIEKTPMDWRETPPRSLLIYDEAQFHEIFKPTRGLSPYKQVEELTIHRKTGHEIWFITQDPSRLHKDILAMVEMHYHLERPYGAKLATIYQYRGPERNPKAVTVKERAERKSLFTYDKKLFELYTSSEVKDGIKLRLPKSIIWWSLLALACIALTIKLFFSDGTQRYVKAGSGGAKAESTVASTTAPTPVISSPAITVASTTAPTQVVSSPPVTVKPMSEGEKEMLRRITIKSVINFNGKCQAYNEFGDKLTLSKADCMAYINKDKSMHYSGADNFNDFDKITGT